ncbi:hypothetical protein C6Q21_27415 [Burkholderia multivorans]|nr:hypothetical protein C6Q21_27415 [Burkholderia multivorans]PRG97946.1 hypothetical protein C6T60_29485 [Burkholderia multivorans]PRH22922.1 hypothetical protein C6T53_19285 [Burkholderia multivorans]
MTSWRAVRPLGIRGRRENARTASAQSGSAAVAAGTGTLRARCMLADSLTARYAVTSYGRIVETRLPLEQAA